MSLIDQALKAAQREKSRLDAESGRAVAPVLVRLRSQPRTHVNPTYVLAGVAGAVALVLAVMWFRAAAADTRLPDVPPVTSAILSEALASDTTARVGTLSQRQAPTAAAISTAPESSPAPAAPTSAMQPPSEPDTRSSVPIEGAGEAAPEPAPRQAGTLRISVEPAPRNGDAARLFAEAIAAHRAEDHERARSLYEQVIALTPDDADALNNLGVILSIQRDFERAHALLRRAVSVAPGNAGAWNNIGALLREQGNPEGAIAAFRQALAIDPRHQGARIGLAQQYLATSALPQARQLLEEVIQGNPTSPEAHYTLGQVLELQGDRAGAIRAYSAFIRYAPARLAAHVQLVRNRIDALSR